MKILYVRLLSGEGRYLDQKHVVWETQQDAVTVHAWSLFGIEPPPGAMIEIAGLYERPMLWPAREQFKAHRLEAPTLPDQY